MSFTCTVKLFHHGFILIFSHEEFDYLRTKKYINENRLMNTLKPKIACCYKFCESNFPFRQPFLLSFTRLLHLFCYLRFARCLYCFDGCVKSLYILFPDDKTTLPLFKKSSNVTLSCLHSTLEHFTTTLSVEYVTCFSLSIGSDCSCKHRIKFTTGTI